MSHRHFSVLCRQHHAEIGLRSPAFYTVNCYIHSQYSVVPRKSGVIKKVLFVRLSCYNQHYFTFGFQAYTTLNSRQKNFCKGYELATEFKISYNTSKKVCWKIYLLNIYFGIFFINTKLLLKRGLNRSLMTLQQDVSASGHQIKLSFLSSPNVKNLMI